MLVYWRVFFGGSPSRKPTPKTRLPRRDKSPPLWENPKLVARKGASNILGQVGRLVTPAMPDQVGHTPHL